MLNRPAIHASLVLLALGVSSAAAKAGPGAQPEGDLARILAGAVALEEVPELRIDVGCLTDKGWHSVEIFGDGLGFWGQRTQIRVPRDAIEGLVESFRTSGFAGWPEQFGRSPAGPKTPPPRTAQPARLICRVRLAAGGEAKEVRQFDKGEVSEGLRRLAYEVLEVGEREADAGVTPEDLAEGLRMILAGRLDPRAFELQVHRRSDGPAPAESAGWILRVHGFAAEVQRYSVSGDLGAVEQHRLDAEVLDAFVRSLVEHRVATLPANLWAEEYTDVRLAVLGLSKEVQARRFAGMTAATHGERQERFTALLADLRRLHRELTSPGARPDTG